MYAALYSLAIMLNVDKQVRDRSGLSEKSTEVRSWCVRAGTSCRPGLLRHRQAPASWRPSLSPAFPTARNHTSEWHCLTWAHRCNVASGGMVYFMQCACAHAHSSLPDEHCFTPCDAGVSLSREHAAAVTPDRKLLPSFPSSATSAVFTDGSELDAPSSTSATRVFRSRSRHYPCERGRRRPARAPGTPTPWERANLQHREHRRAHSAARAAR